MIKRIIGIIAAAAAIALVAPVQPAQAVLKGATFNICVANSDGTYSQVGVVFTNQATAKSLGGHINETAVDLWPATTYSDQYTETNIPASHGYLQQVTTASTYWYRGVKYTYTSTSWVVDPAKAAIYANGCVAP